MWCTLVGYQDESSDLVHTLIPQESLYYKYYNTVFLMLEMWVHPSFL